jgi:hypothetical protein
MHLKRDFVNDIEVVSKFFPEDFKSAKDEALRNKSNAKNDFCSLESNSGRLLGTLPMSVYNFLLRKYGKERMRDKKFMREVFDTLSVFKSCERI